MFENNTDLTENIIENKGFFFNTVRKPSLRFSTFKLAEKYASNIRNKFSWHNHYNLRRYWNLEEFKIE